jgi:hypothetical protein
MPPGDKEQEVEEEPTVPIRRPALAPSANVDEIDLRYARRRRGPFHRFALWASGADRVVLDFAMVEETEHVVQGTLVIFTAIVAGVSGMAAASFLLYGSFALSFASIAIGLLWGTGIFVLDRALVATTYNPYRFSREEVATLTDLHATAPWEHVVARMDTVSRKSQRVRDVLRVLSFGTLLRVLLALATSYIVAEMALFLVFEPEVNARTAYLQGQEQSQRIAEIEARYQKVGNENAAKRAALSGQDNPDVVRLAKELADLDANLIKARFDFGVLSTAAAAEVNGDPYTGTLSDGSAVTTTGRRGDGAAARSLAIRRDNQKSIVDDLAARQASTRTTLDTTREAIKKTNAAGLAQLDEKTNRDIQDRNAEMARVTGEAPLKGLLRRQAALDLLTYDTAPDTLQNDPIPPCHGLFYPVCKVRNWLLPPTPMGPTVIAFRIIFLVIELLPIMFKILQSLRPRRPYEVAKAALEHASMLRSYRLLDGALHDVSGDMVGEATRARRAYTRHGRPPRSRTP